MKTVYGTLWGTDQRIEILLDDEHLNAQGRPLSRVTDQRTGRDYTVQAKSCGIPKCKCELWLRPVKRS